MRRIIVSCGLSGSAIFFRIISQTARFSEKRHPKRNVFSYSLQILSKTFIILRKIQRDTNTNVQSSSRNVTVILVWFHLNLAILGRFLKNTPTSDFMKIRPVGAQLFHADGRTDVTKLIHAFRNFADAPKKPKCRLTCRIQKVRCA
jgi:hypothetical protein